MRRRAAASASGQPGARECPIRIAFAPGAYSGQVEGQLTGIDSHEWFVIDASAGQTMIVIVEGAGATRGIVHFSDGTMDGQPGGRIFDGQLPVSGDSLIEVTEDSMADAWSGPVDVVAVIY